MASGQTTRNHPTGGTSVLSETAPLGPETLDVEAATDTPDRFATIREGAASFRDQALERARLAATEGKETASATLVDYAASVEETARQLEQLAGPQVARYAHQAADWLEELAETLRTRDVDELVEEARELIRRSPALALGGAAAIGFGLSRFLKATSERLEPAPRADRKQAEHA